MAKIPNHLAGQTSPYLLQHLYNPVDWHPWGPEALDRARAEDKPIFLSIGYAACHWCHVMERESFEDERIAEILNRHFVPIKVDREERPDIDEIYMNAVQVMTGQGGWPLNVFLTPAQEPFFGGTYFPPTTSHSRIGFLELLDRIREAWTTQRDELDRSAKELSTRVRRIAAGAPGEPSQDAIGTRETARAAAELASRFDVRWGGFGGAPKFPPDQGVAVLLREHHRGDAEMPLRMVEATLDGMARGGIYDHVGGGFARYSVDERWLVPHFEKMLYNQALLVPVYADAWLVTGKPMYRRVVEETLDFVRRELAGPEGGLFSSLDADSEGVEGKFYVWTPDEIRDVLGAEGAELFCAVYGIDAAGNFEGRSIPNLLGGDLAERAAKLGFSEADLVARLAPLRAKLLEVRERRIRPATDDKVLTAWNGLMISAFCRSYQTLGRERDLRSAEAAAEFVMSRLYVGGRLLASHRGGRSQLDAYLDDHAFLARGLVDLYESTFDRRHLDAAVAIGRAILDRFEDRDRGGFHFVGDDHERLLVRARSSHDGALPSGAGVAVEVLLRLGILLDEPRFRESAMRALRSYRRAVERAPSAYASLLMAAGLAHDGALEIAVVGDPSDIATHELVDQVHRRFLPRRVIAAGEGTAAAGLALLAGKGRVRDSPTAYVCREYACDAPTTDPEELGRQLDAAVARP